MAMKLNEVQAKAVGRYCELMTESINKKIFEVDKEVFVVACLGMLASGLGELTAPQAVEVIANLHESLEEINVVATTLQLNGFAGVLNEANVQFDPSLFDKAV